MASGRLSIVLALGITQTLGWGSTYYLPAILAVPIADDLGLSTLWVFGAFSAALLVSALCGPIVGRRIDRFGGRAALSLSSILFAIGLTVLATATGPASLVAAWIILGVGMSMGLYEVAFSLLARLYGPNARGTITAITLMAGFASTICWPLSAYLEASVGWRVACLVWAAVHLLFGLPLNRIVLPRDSRTAEPLTDAVPDSISHRKRAMLLLAALFAITWFTSAALAAHLPRLLQDAGASASEAIAIAALFGPAQVAGRLMEAGLLGKIHPLYSARLAALLPPVGATALLIFGAPVATLFVVLQGAGTGILTIAKGTLPLFLFGPAGFGYRQGLLMIPTRITQAGAPFLFSVLLDQIGLWALSVSAVLGLGGLITALALSVPKSQT